MPKKKKTRKQLIEQVQTLFQKAQGNKLPVEQIEEGLDYRGFDDYTLSDVLESCLSAQQATMQVRLEDCNTEPEELLDAVYGKQGFAQVSLYDRAAVLKCFDKYLQNAMKPFPFIARDTDSVPCPCKRVKRTNAELQQWITDLTELQDDEAKRAQRQRATILWTQCADALQKAIDQVGDKKVLAAVKAALKAVK